MSSWSTHTYVWVCVYVYMYEYVYMCICAYISASTVRYKFNKIKEVEIRDILWVKTALLASVMLRRCIKDV